MSRGKQRLFSTLAAAGIGALLLTSCSSGGSEPEAPEQAGVAFGASKEEWIAAFEDVEPFEIRSETPAPQGSPGSRAWEAYFASLEEYSGGKITVDLGYSYAYAGITEVDDAVADGTLDMGPLLPTLDPAKYPAYTTMANLTFLTSQSPLVGILHANTYQNTASWATPEILEEFRADGIEPIWMANSLPPTGILCSKPIESLADAQGLQSQASSSAAGQQLQAIGITPVAIPYTDVFESVQRGVLQCTNVFPGQAYLYGVPEVAPYVHFASRAGIVHTPGLVGANADWFNSLPLVAQQLIWDRQTVFFTRTAETTWEVLLEAIKVAEQNGGGALDLADEIQDALIEKGNEPLRAQTLDSTEVDGAALVEVTEEAAADWLDVIESFGFDPRVTLGELEEWLAKNDPDLEGLINEVSQDFILEHRPS